MENKSDFKGSTNSFDKNWQSRKETQYNHWVEGKPRNQIQLAFRKHWELFSELLINQKSGRCIEVGCGRGSISSYFADNGFDCFLLDYSGSVLKTAKSIFDNNSQSASFIQGDAMNLPFNSNCFDISVSIGLLEHFEDFLTPIKEQLRILRPGGIFLGYIVPERSDNIQRYFNWVNQILKWVYELIYGKKVSSGKAPVYRSDYGSEKYLDAVRNLNVEDIRVVGMYPLPMISYSSSFPFTLMPDLFEKALVLFFQIWLSLRKFVFRRNPWICNEKTGQAFLFMFRKKLNE